MILNNQHRNVIKQSSIHFASVIRFYSSNSDDAPDDNPTNRDQYYEQYRNLVSGSGISFMPNTVQESEEKCTLTKGNQVESRPETNGASKPNENKGNKLSHCDDDGKVQMVDVGHKQDTHRLAIAEGKILLGQKAFQLVEQNKMSKGDVLSTAQLAGIMAAKQTSSLIPLCHPIPLTNIKVTLRLNTKDYSVDVSSCVTCTGKTGVEMEALTAVSVACLTVYDMCKAVTHDMIINDVKLVQKSGGQSGQYTRYASKK